MDIHLLEIAYCGAMLATIGLVAAIWYDSEYGAPPIWGRVVFISLINAGLVSSVVGGALYFI